MEINEIKKEIIAEAKTLEQSIIANRRHLHKYPETLYEEEKTAAFIEKELQKIGYTTTRTAETGVIAVLKGEKEGLTVALRADIDALNIQEENSDKPYCSQIPGKMHACGHDGHAAMLLGAAKILFNRKNRINGTIKLIFQPAEEGGGGAKRIVDEGHLNDVDVIFGIHLWHELPSGTIGTRKNMMASADVFVITIKGKGGHAASPHQTIDPTAVLVDIYSAIQKIVTREIDPFQNVVITTPVMTASDAHNVIPPQATLKGTFRTMDVGVRNHIMKRIPEITEGYSTAWRCHGEVVFNEGDMIAYPPLINDEKIVGELSIILNGLDTIVEMEPTMGGEDFAFYLNETRGVFIALGIYNKEKGIIHPHHHPKFDVDEDILWKGTVIYGFLGLYSSFINY
jgi:amidohydrolase